MSQEQPLFYLKISGSRVKVQKVKTRQGTKKTICFFGIPLFPAALLIVCFFSLTASFREARNSPKSQTTSKKGITISKKGITIIQEKDSGKIIRLSVNDLIQIELLGTPSSGSWWRFTALNREYFEILDENTREIKPEMPDGGPIMGIWRLRAKRVGTSILEMAYYRTWEKEDTAIKRLRVIVRIEE